MKLVFENDRPVPSGSDTKSHSRHYVPSGQDAFSQTYRHILSVGAFNIQENMRDKYQEQIQKRIARCKELSAMCKRIS